MRDLSITFRYIITAFIVVLATWILHEFAHWATSELLGYSSTMSLNSSSPLNPSEVDKTHHIYISAAGPLITILQGFLAYFLLKRFWSKTVYLFLFIAFYMRLMAGLMNVVTPNDEGRISEFLSLGTYTVPALVSTLLFYWVYRISKKHRLTNRFHLITTLIVMVFTSALILTDQFFKVTLL